MVWGIRPQLFRSLIGKHGSQFANSKQQDPSEFFMLLMSMLASTAHMKNHYVMRHCIVPMQL